MLLFVLESGQMTLFMDMLLQMMLASGEMPSRAEIAHLIG